MAPAAGRAATRTPARVLGARCGTYWPRARDTAGMDTLQQAARSGGGGIPLAQLQMVHCKLLGMPKVLFLMDQRTYGGQGVVVGG